MSTKIDMSLDQIIKMQGKQKQIGKNWKGKNTHFGKGKARTTSFSNRKIKTQVSGTSTRMRSRLSFKVPVTGQRMARNLLKRAMLSGRRETINNRHSARNGSSLAIDREFVSGNKTLKLQREVQKLRGAVKLLSGALQGHEKPHLNQINRFKPSNPRFLTTSIVQNRIGWNQLNRKANVNIKQEGNQRHYNNVQVSMPNHKVRGRGNPMFLNSTTYNSMQSDAASREEARQHRMMADLMALAQSRNIGDRNQTPVRRFQQNQNTSPMLRSKNTMLKNFNDRKDDHIRSSNGRSVSFPQNRLFNKAVNRSLARNNFGKGQSGYRNKQFIRERLNGNGKFRGSRRFF